MRAEKNWRPHAHFELMLGKHDAQTPAAAAVVMMPFADCLQHRAANNPHASQFRWCNIYVHKTPLQLPSYTLCIVPMHTMCIHASWNTEGVLVVGATAALAPAHHLSHTFIAPTGTGAVAAAGPGRDDDDMRQMVICFVSHAPVAECTDSTGGAPACQMLSTHARTVPSLSLTVILCKTSLLLR